MAKVSKAIDPIWKFREFKGTEKKRGVTEKKEGIRDIYFSR